MEVDVNEVHERAAWVSVKEFALLDSLTRLVLFHQFDRLRIERL